MQSNLIKSVLDKKLFVDSFKGKEPEEFFQSRKELFTHVLNNGLPHKKNPFWKYSPIEKVISSFFIGNTINNKLIDTISDDMVFDSAINIMDKYKELFEKILTKTDYLKKSYFGSIAATLSIPRVLIIPKCYSNTIPIEITFRNSYDRLIVIIEEGAEVHIVEKCDMKEDFKIALVEYILKEDAKLTLISLSDVKQSKRVLARYITVNAHAKFNYLTNQSKGTYIRDEVTVSLIGAHAKARVAGTINISGNIYSDSRIEIQQLVPDTMSKTLYRYLLSDNAVGIFGGKVIIPKGADRTVADMKSNAIVLSDSARIYGEPQFEIYNDDVICTHGTSTGALDEEALLYLQTRGVAPKEGRALLLESFLTEPERLVLKN